MDEKKKGHMNQPLLQPKEEHPVSIHAPFVNTTIPARLDRLPFSRYHWFIVFTLGITWLLDGLETTMFGVVSGILKSKDGMNFSDLEIGLCGSFYLGGAVIGSLFFGYLCDRIGRKKLYIITPLIYLSATGLTAFSFNFYTFAILRAIAGAGLGGEYAAMNSAIDELIPAPVRGTVDLVVNGSYWLGSVLSSVVSFCLLSQFSNVNLGWRILFFLGSALGLLILVLRIFLPESPRWLLTHGREEEAEAIVAKIEERVCRWNKINPVDLPAPEKSIVIYHRTGNTGFKDIFRVMFKIYPKRSFLGMILMITQAFFYNAVFFSYALVLIDFFDVASDRVGLYLIPFSIVNFLGPLFLGHLFDIIGRRIMISVTYSISGILLIVFGFLFWKSHFTAITLTLFASFIFFFASPAASSAYLTVSEIFPLEIRALAISFFYSIGTLAGGVLGPTLFGYLLGPKLPGRVFIGYLIGAACMIIGGLVEMIFGIDAEGKSLEDIAPPLASHEEISEQEEKK